HLALATNSTICCHPSRTKHSFRHFKRPRPSFRGQIKPRRATIGAYTCACSSCCPPSKPCTEKLSGLNPTRNVPAKSTASSPARHERRNFEFLILLITDGHWATSSPPSKPTRISRA